MPLTERRVRILGLSGFAEIILRSEWFTGEEIYRWDDVYCVLCNTAKFDFARYRDYGQVHGIDKKRFTIFSIRFAVPTTSRFKHLYFADLQE